MFLLLITVEMIRHTYVDIDTVITHVTHVTKASPDKGISEDAKDSSRRWRELYGQIKEVGEFRTYNAMSIVLAP